MKITSIFNCSAVALIIYFCTSFQAAAQVNDLLRSEVATLTIMQNAGIDFNSVPKLVSQDVSVQGAQDFVTIRLQFDHLPLIRLFLNGPHGFFDDTQHSYRTVFIVAGFFTGSQSASLLSVVPKTVYVGYDYPYDVDAFKQDASKVLQTFRITPPQIALSMKWLSLQGWVDASKTTALGVSLGGLFLPVSLHVAMKLQAAPQFSVFAFTGADLAVILTNVLPTELPQNVSDGVKAFVPAINILNDPAIHLPFLSGSFLVIHSDQDQVIPAEATAKLFALLPEPKTEVLLHGPHINPDQQQLIDDTGKEILNWLK